VVSAPVSWVGILWFWQSFDKTQRVEETLHYYFSKLCSILLPHYYAQNYAGIMSATLEKTGRRRFAAQVRLRKRGKNL